MAERKRMEAAAEKEEPGEPIHVKYRPRSLKDVLGQEAVVKSLQKALDSNSRPHTYLFTGPAGTGKTTLARICASMLKIETITEVDAASTSGIDDMRAITAALRYNGFGATPNKAIILNECQGLSKAAWDSLLTSTEEPPAHVFFFFTSTNPEKIPKALLTRAQAYDLRPLRYDDLMDLLDDVVDREGFDPAKGVLEEIANACEGSARQALTMLAKVHACDDLDEARVLLQVAGEHPEAITLARDLVAGKLKWDQMTKTLKALTEEGVAPESVRLMIVNYLNACLMGGGPDARVERLLDMLACFMKPAIGPEKAAQLLLAFGRHIYP